jgi:prolyl-tRNA editing enzyme YbaK/EbsC (Cys-tRNA(Pro) deacylase)
VPSLRLTDPQDPCRPERNALLSTLHPTALKFSSRAASLGLELDVKELEQSTRTAQEAADAVGCELGQIVKSVVLMDGGEPLLCLTAGDRRVDVDRLGPDVRLARGRDVKELTGYAIGGVPPVGHDRAIRTVVDRSLLRYETVWCAAGTPYALCAVRLSDLLAALGGHELVETT